MQLGNVIDDYYEPVEDLREVDAFIGTDDIYDALQNIFPSQAYSAMDLTYALIDAGFNFVPVPGPAMQFAWLIKRR